jgi:hypothetical protein
VLAHIAGVPVEEFLPVVVSGLGTGLALALSSALSRVRRSAGLDDDRPQDAEVGVG